MQISEHVVFCAGLGVSDLWISCILYACRCASYTVRQAQSYLARASCPYLLVGLLIDDGLAKLLRWDFAFKKNVEFSETPTLALWQAKVRPDESKEARTELWRVSNKPGSVRKMVADPEET